MCVVTYTASCNGIIKAVLQTATTKECVPEPVQEFRGGGGGGVNLILPHSGSQKKQNWDEVDPPPPPPPPNLAVLFK